MAAYREKPHANASSPGKIRCPVQFSLLRPHFYRLNMYPTHSTSFLANSSYRSFTKISSFATAAAIGNTSGSEIIRLLRTLFDGRSLIAADFKPIMLTCLENSDNSQFSDSKFFNSRYRNSKEKAGFDADRTKANYREVGYLRGPFSISRNVGNRA